jgi:hypothetical protein
MRAFKESNHKTFIYFYKIAFIYFSFIHLYLKHSKSRIHSHLISHHLQNRFFFLEKVKYFIAFLIDKLAFKESIFLIGPDSTMILLLENQLLSFYYSNLF